MTCYTPNKDGFPWVGLRHVDSNRIQRCVESKWKQLHILLTSPDFILPLAFPLPPLVIPGPSHKLHKFQCLEYSSPHSSHRQGRRERLNNWALEHIPRLQFSQLIFPLQTVVNNSVILSGYLEGLNKLTQVKQLLQCPEQRKGSTD